LRRKIFGTLRRCGTVGVFSKTEAQQFFCDIFEFFRSSDSINDLEEISHFIMLDFFQDDDTMNALFMNLDGSHNLLKFR
ncbi:hypothetical protein PFISCL1PPCAC_9686, partial [Pristionchus fissidentatus]